MRLFLLLLVCLPDHDLRLFIIRWGFFPAGEKLLYEAMRLLSYNEISLPHFNTDFLHYRVQSAWLFNVSVTLPTLQRCWEEKIY